MKIATYKFRPRQFPNRLYMKARMKGYPWTGSSFVERMDFPPNIKNRPILRKIYFRLEGLAYHGPDQATKRYWRAYIKFCQDHFGCGKGKQSVNYSNTWTCQL